MKGERSNDGGGPGDERPIRRKRKMTVKAVQALCTEAKKCSSEYQRGQCSEEFLAYADNFKKQNLSKDRHLELIEEVIYAKEPMFCSKCRGTEFRRQQGVRSAKCLGCGLIKWPTASSFFSHVKAPDLLNAMLGAVEAGIPFNPNQFARVFNCSYGTANPMYAKIQRAMALELEQDEEIASLNTRAFGSITTRRSWQTPAGQYAETEQEVAEKENAEQENAEQEIARSETFKSENSESVSAESALTKIIDEVADLASGHASGHAPGQASGPAIQPPASHLADQPESQPVEYSIEQKAEQPMEERVEKLIEQPAKQPADPAAEQLIEDLTEVDNCAALAGLSSGNEDKILHFIRKSTVPVSFDVLLEKCNLTCAKLSSALTMLELQDLICSVPGGRFALSKSDIAFNALKFSGDMPRSARDRLAKGSVSGGPGRPLPKYLERLAEAHCKFIKVVHQGISRKRLDLYLAGQTYLFRVRAGGLTTPLRELLAASNWGSRGDLRRLKCPLLVKVYALT